MADKDNKEEQAAVEALEALTADGEAQLQADKAGDEHPAPQVDVAHEIDDLSMVELVPQATDALAEPQLDVEGEGVANDIDAAPQLDLAQSEAANLAASSAADTPAEVASASPEEAKDSKAQTSSPVEEQSKKPTEKNKKQKKHSTSSGLALPSFAERSDTGVFGSVGTRTGIPLPPRATADSKQAKPVEAVDNVEQLPEQKQTLLSKKTAVSKKQPEAEKEQTRAEFADTDGDVDVYGDGEPTQIGITHTETNIAAEQEEDMLAAREFGAALTANKMFAYEPLGSLNKHPHLFTAMTHVKGVWKSTVSIDELIVAAAREGQSDQRSNEVKNWYAMRMKKLIVNVIDFVWIARAYEMSEEGLLIVEDEQLFIALTGLSSSDFLELCKQGFIQHRHLAALVRQCQLWEEETYNPADYIFVHLHRERMVA